MSDASEPRQTSPDGKNQPSRPRRTWKARLKRIALILLALAVILRVALAILLPVAIHRAAAFYGLTCDYSRARLGLVGGYATLWDISISPQEGGSPIFTAQFCEGNISTLNLLRGRLVIWRIGADGVWIDLQRQADGAIPMLQRFASPPAKVAAPTAASPQRELDLRAPLQVDAFRLDHMRAHIQDRSVSPAFETTLTMNLRVSDLGHEDKPARIEMDVWSEHFLDQLRLNGEARSAGRNVKAQFHLQAHGIDPTGTPGYLRRFGFRPLSNDVNTTAELTVETSAVEGSRQALMGTVALRNVRIYGDGSDALKIDSIVLSPRYIGPDRIDAGTITISDVTASAKRTPEGIAFGGLLYSGPIQRTPATQPSTTPAEPLAASTQPSAFPAVSLDELVVRNVRLTFADQAIEPAARLGLTLKNLRLANLATYAGTGRRPVELSAEMAAEGIAQTITIHGRADPFAAAKNGSFAMHIGGIRLDALRPYLEAAGLESTLEDAALNCELSATFKTRPDGVLEGEIKANDVSFSDRAPLLKLTNAQVTGCEIDPKTLAVRIGAIDIAGPSISGWRDAKGQMTILGMRTKPAVVKPVASTAEPRPAAASSVVLPIPHIRVDRFTWKDIRLDLQDDYARPATKLAITDAGIELTDIDLESTATTQPAQEGKLRAWIKFPGVVDDLQMTGTFTPTLRSAKLATDTRMEGITGALIAPYLSVAGITPVLKKGSFTAHTESFVELTPGGLVAELLLKDLRLEDDGRLLMGISGMQVEGFRMESPLLEVRSARLNHPYLALEREADGSMVIVGMRMSSAARAAKASPDASPKISALPLVAAQQFAVENAEVAWTDRMFTPALQLGARADVTIAELKLGIKAEAPKLTLNASVPGNIDDINFEGLLVTSPGEFGLDGSLVLSGIKGGSAQAYLPPTLAVGMNNGQANLRLLARAANNPAGGISAAVELRNLDLREKAAATPLLAMQSLKASASRIDPPGMVVALDELSVQGLLAAIERTAKGDVLVAGMRSLSQATTDRPAPLAAKQQGSTGPEQDVSTILAEARRPMPEVSVAKLLIDAPEIRFRDAMRPTAAPLTIENLRLWNLDRLVWLGKDAMSQPANRFELAMRVNPLIERLRLLVETAPLAAQSSAHVHINADGIHGAGLNALVPELAGKVDGSSLHNGRFEADLETSARIARRGPLQLDLHHEFQMDLSIRNVSLREGNDGRVLAGVQEIRAAAVKVDPTGHLIQLPSLEITKPIAFVSRDHAGLHVLGMLVPASPETRTGSPSSVPSVAYGGGNAAPASVPDAKAMDVVVRKLIVSGIDVVYVDTALQPRVIVPLNELDIEVQDIGTTSPKQNKPIRFSVMVGSGKVDVAKRGRSTAGAQNTTEQRELFSLATVNGAVALYPHTNGWAKASINGLELTALAGATGKSGVELHDGILDCDVDLRIRDETNTDVRTRVVLTDLSLSEPSDGPIARSLKLPTSLDTTLKLLQDPDGSITLPLKFAITNGEVSQGTMTSAATEAAVQVIATAVASSPLKLVQGVGGLFGAETQKGKKALPTALVTFTPGAASVASLELDEIQAFAERARRDSSVQLVLREELSEADWMLAKARANPGTEDAMDMIRALRSRKQDLLAQQQMKSVDVRTRLAAIPESAMQAELRELQSIYQQLDSVESSLDQLLDLQRPGADRQTDRRSRAMAVKLGQARLDAVQQIIMQSPELQQRIMVVPPSAKVIDSLVSGQVIVTLVQRQR